MKFTRTTTEYTWTDNETNTQIAKELNITQILDEKQDYRRIWLQHASRNWIQHVNRMPRNRLSWIIKPANQKAEGIRGDH